MKRIYLILTGISLILLSSCAQRAQEAKGHQTVKIDTVVSADKQTFLQFPGKVKAAQDISLAFRVSGTISKIHVKDGARVQEGQLLAELDPTDYQVQLDATEAEYQQIKAEAERVMALYKDNGTTPQTPMTKPYTGSSKSPPSTNTIKISWLTPGSMLLSTGMSRNACSKLTKPSEPECPSLP